ncbi:MAG TPA: heparinase II/III family protein, partial [Hyphomicrobiaceae bacterium]|nr:heparinase II/III family protein [Hyphomicrobiaceae bacterium]
MAPALLENLWRVTGRRVGGARRRSLGDPAHVPPTLKGVDPCFIEEWSEGWFTLSGHPIALDGRSPLEVADAPPDWLRALHGFDWLVDVPLVPEDDLALTFRDRTRALVAEWLAHGTSSNAVAARTDVTARRLLSFLAHADLVLETAQARTYDLYARQIARDADHLLSEWRSLDDEGRVVALSAVAQAGLACDNGAVMHARAEAALLSELDRQILSDGGHLSRDPRVIPALLLDLIPLRQLYGVAHRTAPRLLVDTIGRMIEFASVLRLGDGQLTHLSGRRTDHDIALPPLTLLGTPPQRWYGAASGFARVAEGPTVLIVDAGADHSSAGALSFEWSAGPVPVVMSAGDTSVLRLGSRSHGRPAGSTLRRATQSTLMIDAPTAAPRADAPPQPTLAQRQGIDIVTVPGSGTRIDSTH